TKGWQQEGLARFQVGEAFFRSSSQIGRDLGVLAAIAHKQTHHSLRVLDAMTGCGVRPLRYALEAEADYVWANEGNWDLHDLLHANLSRGLECDRYQLTHQDANSLFFDCHQRQDFYDLIDIDSFGSSMPTLATSLWAVKLGGLLYLTSTDGRATSGHAPEKSLQTYSAYARSHPAIHEQGLRLLIGLVMQQAAARGLSAQPVFSWYHGEVNRVMMRIGRTVKHTTHKNQTHKNKIKLNSNSYGFLSYCHSCGQFQTVTWKKLGRTQPCTCRADIPPVISGPMWLGPLHNSQDLANMQQIAVSLQKPDQAPDQTAHWKRAQALLNIMQAESSLPPYHYPLAEIGKRGKMDIPPRDILIQALKQAGFLGTRTHLNTQAIKTTAPLATCIELARQVSHSRCSPE
ncbi:MAG: hypothetical protein AAGM27_12390, partial [Cyanobacteria bacterium J06554_3]